MTKNGKRVMNVKPGVEAVSCRPVDGDHVAVVGENRKLLIFKIGGKCPSWGAGRASICSATRMAGWIDAATFHLEGGIEG